MVTYLGEKISQVKDFFSRWREVPTFGYNDIREIEGRYRLHVRLAKTGFLLPLVHLNIPYPHEAALGWFDPNPEKNPQLDEAATAEMEKILKKLKPKVVVMTNSSKSEHFIREAVRSLPPGTELILLPSGDNEDEIKGRSREDANFVDYVPVTHVQKWMGYPKKMEDEQNYMTLEELKKAYPNSGDWVLVDDVYTTGKTIRAMEKVLGLGPKSRHNIAVIAVEKKFDGRYQKISLPKRLHAVFNLTEFTDLSRLNIDRSRLHVYDKLTIPPAIVKNE